MKTTKDIVDKVISLKIKRDLFFLNYLPGFYISQEIIVYLGRFQSNPDRIYLVEHLRNFTRIIKEKNSIILEKEFPGGSKYFKQFTLNWLADIIEENHWDEIPSFFKVINRQSKKIILRILWIITAQRQKTSPAQMKILERPNQNYAYPV